MPKSRGARARDLKRRVRQAAERKRLRAALPDAIESDRHSAQNQPPTTRTDHGEAVKLLRRLHELGEPIHQYTRLFVNVPRPATKEGEEDKSMAAAMIGQIIDPCLAR